MNTRTEPLRIAVLGSGGGSNFQAILDAMHRGALRAQVVCVLSDVADAFILERARRNGIPAHFVSGAPFRTKLEGPAEDAYLARLQAHAAEVVVLAGFMRILKARFLNFAISASRMSFSAASPGSVSFVHRSRVALSNSMKGRAACRKVSLFPLPDSALATR